MKRNYNPGRLNACWSPAPFLITLFTSLVVFQLLLLSLLIRQTPAQYYASTPKEEETLQYLKSLSIHDLLQTEVTSVSKKNEKLSDTAAAVFVITAEDIRHSGAQSIPELLRVVPGLQVARIDANKWMVTARGFSNRFSNKLLVLIDGRSVYNPLFSGVYWDVQDTMLEDIERIEVIRGPGAALWGANAVNGIINILTKSSKDTLGGYIAVGTGSHTDYHASVRYGGKIGKEATYRLFAKGFQHDDFEDSTGHDSTDAWDTVRGGFRVDTASGTDDDFSLQGGLYDGNADQRITITGLLTPPFTLTQKDTIDFSGGHLMGCWKHRFSNDSQATLQIYYDRTERKEKIFGEIRDTLDVDFQHQWSPTTRQEVVWGAGYRLNKDNTDGTFTISVSPRSRTDHLFSAFVQDTVELIENQIWVTLGTKLEKNDYTGTEVQPSARLRWQYSPHLTLWGAVSRAVRTPSRADHDLRVNLASFPGTGGTVNVMAVTGEDGFDSEELTAFEFGFRWYPTYWFSIDAATFYNIYDELRSIEFGNPFFESFPTPPHMVFPLTIGNELDGDTHGIEVYTRLQPMDWWKLSLGYTWFQIDLDLDPASQDPNAQEYEGNSPDHQLQFCSMVSLPHHVEWDTALFFVDKLDNFAISEYWRLDTRIGWQPTRNVTLSLHLENILDDRHLEYGNQSGINASEVPRSIYATVNYRY